jgi:hypothetical protein
LGTDGTLGSGTNGDATNHVVGSTSSCVDCHNIGGRDYPNDFDGAHTEGDHITRSSGQYILATSANCTPCHAGSTSSDIINDVHNNNCQTCHAGTSTNGSLRAGTNGDATVHTIDSTTSCIECHGGGSGADDYSSEFGTAHDSKSHAEVVGTSGATPTTNCVGCHTGDIVNLDATADVHNDNCQNCHNNTTTDGKLHAGDTAASYDGSNIHGTTANHTLGDTSGCVTCHTAASNFTDFDSHTNRTATNHSADGSGTTVEQAAGDESGGTSCSNCHNDATAITMQAQALRTGVLFTKST